MPVICVCTHTCTLAASLTDGDGGEADCYGKAVPMAMSSRVSCRNHYYDDDLYYVVQWNLRTRNTLGTIQIHLLPIHSPA